MGSGDGVGVAAGAGVGVTVAGGEGLGDGEALAPGVADRLMNRLRSPVPTLSGRELEILGLLAQGLSNRAISKRLFISEATVKTHLVHVFEKLGVDNRTAAITTALRRGLIRVD